MSPCRSPLLLLALAAGLAAPACREPAARTARSDDQPPARSVRVAPAASGSLPRVVEVGGTLAAEQQVALALKVAGRVSVMRVDLGSRAAPGQELARLSPVDFELRVRQAEAALEQARARLGLAPGEPERPIEPEEASLVKQARAVLDEARLTRDRAERLWREQLVPRSELDQAEASWQVADGRYQDAIDEVLNRQALLAQRRSELDLARQQLSDSVLRAPFNGAVRERHASVGQFVPAGEPIVTFVKTDPLRLRLAVPERESASLRVGQEVRLTVEGDPAVHAGRVARLSPALEERSRTLMVEAEVPNPGGALRPGSFASAVILTSPGDPVVLVPASSIVTFAGIEKIFTVQDGKAVEKRVVTGRRHEGQVEIQEGLEAGEPVVVEPGNLAGGQAVSIEG